MENDFNFNAKNYLGYPLELSKQAEGEKQTC